MRFVEVKQRVEIAVQQELPLVRMPTVSANRRTSSSMWLEISTVCPRSQIVRNTPSKNSSRAIGSKPESGSSNNNNSGSCETANSSASFTSVPFERCFTFFSRSRPNNSTISRQVWSFHERKHDLQKPMTSRTRIQR